MSENPTVKTILIEAMKQGKVDITKMSPKKQKLVKDILICHTVACGFSISVCPKCGKAEIHYGSCNNPACPMCGKVKREIWADNLYEKLPESNYYHIVFTIPAELNRLCLHDSTFMYNTLFAASAEAIKKILGDKKWMGAEKLGFFSVLHTWGQNLSLHPHIHMVLCGTGIDEEGNLVIPKRKGGKYLVPAKALAKLFKGIFMDKVRKKYEKEVNWEKDLNSAAKSRWNIEIREKHENTGHVVEYLGRYVNRIAISNGRLKEYDGNEVEFSYKDYRDHNKIKTMKLTDKEFLRRYFMHVLPERFAKIRYYGFFGNSQKNQAEEVRKKLGKMQDVKKKVRKTIEVLNEIMGRDIRKCIHCGASLADFIWTHLDIIKSRKKTYLRNFMIREQLE